MGSKLNFLTSLLERY